MKKCMAWLVLIALLCAFTGALAADVVFTGDTHVRYGPGLDYDSKGIARKGTRLEYNEDWEYDDRGVTWYQVAFGNSYGWVSEKYSYIDSSSGGWVYVKSESNVRTAPNLNASKLGSVRTGGELEYAGETAYDSRGVAWYRVYWGNEMGWISSRYTELYYY